METLKECPHCSNSSIKLVGERTAHDPYLELVDSKLNQEARFWWSCNLCKLHFASPRITESEAEVLYQKYRCPTFRGKTALEYFESIASLDDEESESFQKLLCLRSTLKSVPTIESVLDFGCGGGINLFHLGRLMPEVKLQGLEPNQDYQRMVVNKLNIPIFSELSDVKDFVDLSLCIDVIEHLHSPKFMMRSLSQITTRLIYIEIPSPQAFQRLPIDHDVFASPHLYFFDKTHIQSIAESIQFKIKTQWQSSWRQVPKDFYLLERVS